MARANTTPTNLSVTPYCFAPWMHTARISVKAEMKLLNHICTNYNVSERLSRTIWNRNSTYLYRRSRGFTGACPRDVKAKGDATP